MTNALVDLRLKQVRMTIVNRYSSLLHALSGYVNKVNKANMDIGHMKFM
jgi:hypothetical protein